MSKASKKGRGRPRKRDHSKFLATFGHLRGMTFENFGLTEDEARRLETGGFLTDPLSNDPLFMAVFTPSITGDADEKTREWVGLLLADALNELNAEQLKELFDRILKLKKEAERAKTQCPHRNFFANQGYHAFKKEFGFVPTKQKLKDFMLVSPDVYLGLPIEDDTKAWSDMLNAAPEMEPGFFPNH
jgi:hypothetical protein